MSFVRTPHGALSLLVIGALMIGVAACGGSEEPAETSGPDTEATPAAPPQAEQEIGEVAEDPTFELRASARGPYVVGEEGNFEIRLTPRGEYHVNEDFPLTIELSGPDGVEVPTGELGADRAAELNENRARFDIPVTARSAGEHRVTARVNFAVCTPEACVPEERTLALVLPAE